MKAEDNDFAVLERIQTILTDYPEKLNTEVIYDLLPSYSKLETI